jgi:transcriptional regulator with PAS, ATPase and Fis domain
MEERLMDTLVQFSSLLDLFVSRIREGVILTDNLGTVLYSNLAACCFLGIPRPGDAQQATHKPDIRLPRSLLTTAQSYWAKRPEHAIDNHSRHFVKQRIDNNGSSHLVDIDMTSVTLPGSSTPIHLMFVSEPHDQRRPAIDNVPTASSELCTESPCMQEIREMLQQIAPTMASVLLQGESGTGKTLLARLVHEHSNQAKSPLVEVNCAAIPENLLESELFGHVKGAFTGAVSDRPGRLQAADGGTLFLDEVSEIPLHLQSKLLKALDEKCFQMVGSDKNIRVNIRIIAASNRNLRDMVDAGTFRPDLYYRLAVFSLTVPALRERPDDITALIQHLHRRFVKRGYSDGLEYSADAMAMLLNYPWPGNVRELSNAVEHAMILATNGLITPKCLPCDIHDYHVNNTTHTTSENNPCCEITDALESACGNRAEAARKLGIDRTTLWRRMHRLGLS